jgi:hypothetical protein
MNHECTSHRTLIGFASALLGCALSAHAAAENSDTRPIASPSESVPALSAASVDAQGSLGLADLGRAWFDPWPHSHKSASGTPRVHHFLLEPAFLGRELLTDFRMVNGVDEDEMELEAEIEWALTRRMGLVLEAPMESIKPADESRETGLGDLGLGVRAVLLDLPRLTFAASLGASIPTGDEDRGLGSGEIELSPSLAAWIDLGGWVALNLQAGTSHGLKSDDAEFFWRGGLSWSFMLYGDDAPHTHGHFSPGMFSLLGEIDGRTGLSGEDNDTSTAQALLGASLSLTSKVDVRGGYILPLGKPREIDNAFILGVVVHF